MIDAISTNIPEISKNQHGTRAVQKLIEIAYKYNYYQKIIDPLKEDLLDLIKDNSATHVIQKCITTFSAEKNQFICDIIL